MLTGNTKGLAHWHILRYREPLIGSIKKAAKSIGRLSFLSDNTLDHGDCYFIRAGKKYFLKDYLSVPFPWLSGTWMTAVGLVQNVLSQLKDLMIRVTEESK